MSNTSGFMKKLTEFVPEGVADQIGNLDPNDIAEIGGKCLKSLCGQKNESDNQGGSGASEEKPNEQEGGGADGGSGPQS